MASSTKLSAALLIFSVLLNSSTFSGAYCGLVNLQIGGPPTSPCCALLKGLTDLEVALCLCTALKANVLGINLDVPIALSLLVSACQKTIPSGFQCE
ncbi:hypothetical protein M0R45_011468 [Rubus argutus]|uniref:Bifunctional inhibitor/plant lipid transfer protein/seed storage helical domain-containing protein n=1 Tax=Rubus argutus TaxID=59490 RepID=A0AAW1YB66_RUBAR